MSHPLVARLREGDAAARRATCAAIPDDAAAVLLIEPLGNTLADPDPAVRRAAGDALVRIGREAREVDALLLRVLRGDEPASRFEAARALAELAPPSPKLVPVLVEALASPRRETAWEAARLLVDAGRLHPEVTPIVIGLVRAAPSPAARAMAVACLRELAPEHPGAEPALLEASRDAHASLRRAAFTALPAVTTHLPPGAASAARCREAAGGDADPAVRRLAARALEIIGQRHGPDASTGNSLPGARERRS